MAKTTKKRVTFTLDEPNATSVQLAGDFSDWEKQPLDLKRQKNGAWKVTVSLPPGSYQYLFLVDNQWREDPACPTRAANPFGGMNCVITVE